MKIVRPEDLASSRTFFADMEGALIQADTNAELKQAIERKIKILALSKGHIVLPALLMMEGLDYLEILQKCPDLLGRGVVVPAFPEPFVCFEDILDAPTTPALVNPKRAAHFIEAANVFGMQSASAVTFNAESADAWFRQSLLSQLGSAGSPLHFMVPSHHISMLEQIASAVEDSTTLTRVDALRLIARRRDELGLEAERILRDFVVILHYISGARAVSSLGVLPQENLDQAEVRLVDTERPAYSEAWMFWNLVVQTYCEMARIKISEAVIDLLPPDAILEVRERIVGEAFRRKFNRLLELTKSNVVITDPEKIILSLSEVDELMRDLQRVFRLEIEQEILSRRRRQAMVDTTRGVIETGLIFVKPFFPMFDSADSAIKPLGHFFRAIVGSEQTDKVHDQAVARLDNAKDFLLRRARPRQNDEGTVFIDFITALRARAVKHLTEEAEVIVAGDNRI